ncbi:MAG: uracil-DNA glycosylase [Chloroflexota bacterium]
MDQTVLAELGMLKEEMEEVQPGQLFAPSGRLVFGEGDPTSPFVIVGEGPGERDAMEGRPFVGRAGQLLDRLMAATGLDRKEVWLTNVLKRRPHRRRGDQWRSCPPKVDELAYYKSYLYRELKIISPRLILCLGNLAARVLIHESFRMTQERGLWFTGRLGQRLMSTYHPAYILRLQETDCDEVLSQTLEDFAGAAAQYRALGEELVEGSATLATL